MKKQKLNLLVSLGLLMSITSNALPVYSINVDMKNLSYNVNEKREYISENLVENFSFESLTDINSGEWDGEKFANAWTPNKFSGNYNKINMTIVDDIKSQDDYSLKMESILDNSRGFINQNIEVKPNTSYELAADIKVENILPMMFGIQIFESVDGKYIDTDANRTTLIRDDGTKDWTNRKYIFKTGDKTQSITLRLNMGTNQGVKKGSKAWIDNISLKEVSIPVEDVILSKTNISAPVGTTHQLNATLLPQSATNKGLIWQSSNDLIASVDNNGNVNLNSIGEAIIKVKSLDGGYEATCNVNVVGNEIIESIELEKEIEIEIGSNVKIKPIVIPSLEGIKFNWSSNDEQIVSVDENGLLIAKSKGEATITVQYADKSSQMIVKVVDKKKNLLPNGGFEEYKDGIPKNYKFTSIEGESNISISQDDSYRDNNSVRIENITDGISKLSTANRLSLGDGIYSVSVMVKYENFEGEGLKINLNQNKSDDIYIDVKSDFLVDENGEKYQKLEFIYDAIHFLRSISLDLILEGKGIAKIDEIKLVKLNSPEKIELKNKQIDLNSDENKFKIENKIISQNSLVDQRLKWYSSNSNILKVAQNGECEALKAGEVKVYAMTIDGKIIGESLVNIKGEIPKENIIAVESLDIGTDINIELGEGYKIIPEIKPIEATLKDLDWKSLDENIAKVIDGRIFAVGIGQTIISAKTNNGIEKNIDVNVTENIKDKYESALDSWGNKVSVNKSLDALVEEANNLFNQMNKDSGRIYLWDNLKDIRISSNIKKMLDNLKVISLAVANKDSSLYMRQDIINEIIKAINFIYENCYNEKLKENYRAWDWEIGITKNFGDIISLMYPYMTENEKKAPAKFITEIILPDVKIARSSTDGPIKPMTGANLTDAVKGVIIPHLVLKEDAKINYALDAAIGTLSLVTEGDGFYKDGSFIQHENVAYTGSYGVELLKGISSLMDSLSDSEFDVNKHKDIANTYEIVENSFIPIMYKGALMDMTRGRAISRPENTDHTNGHVVIDCLILIGNSAQKQEKEKFLSIAKRMLLDDKAHLNQITDPARNKRAMDLLNDKSIKPAKDMNYNKEFSSMDKTVHKAENFGFAISKSSKRIANYELLNGENKKGWHTGDGMTYLYNEDKDQFTDHFWATVDYYRLPGTTVDTGRRVSDHNQFGDGEGAPKNSWSGGASLDEYGVSGINLQSMKKDGTTLKANKSWFMFDNEIIAMGSDINSADNRDIETIVEQRMINGDNKFIVDGKKKINKIGESDEILNPTWAHLKGDKKGEDIGYYFPDKQNLNILRESRTGDYKDINDGKTGVHTRNYLTMYFNHGKSPKEESYVYSILPGMTQGQVKKYSEDPNFKVIENSKNIHAIEEENLDVFAANFFEDGYQRVGDIAVDRKSSVILRENDEFIELSVSDPTHENTGFITIDLFDYDIEKLITQDDRVTLVEINDDKVVVKINVKDLAGETVKIKFKED